MVFRERERERERIRCVRHANCSFALCRWILGENKHRDMQAQKSLKELRELTKCSDEVATGGSGSPTKRDGTESYKRIPDFHDFLATTSGPIDVSNKR